MMMMMLLIRPWYYSNSECTWNRNWINAFVGKCHYYTERQCDDCYYHGRNSQRRVSRRHEGMATKHQLRQWQEQQKISMAPRMNKTWWRNSGYLNVSIFCHGWFLQWQKNCERWSVPLTIVEKLFVLSLPECKCWYMHPKLDIIRIEE